MLAKQTVIYFIANVVSAAFGLLNTVVFTRIFAVEAFGDYLLGLAFATLLATVLASALKLSIMREQARGDGADMRATALAALLLYCPAAPLGYGVARLAHLEPMAAATSVLLAFAIVLFDVSQELLRAEQKATAVMRGTIMRAILVSVLGVACTALAATGAALLASSALAFLFSAASFWRAAWGASRPRFDRARLAETVVSGLPFTLSLSLLALAGMSDRFLLAGLAGVAASGQFGASFDLARQALIIPAISVASAFVPMAVRLLASNGADDARAHLGKCLELLLAITLPACVGFALVSPQIADLVLGPEFRQTARDALPALAAAVVFQILTQQYLHTSFLLSNRNMFYLVNTGSIVVFNVVVSFLLITRFGVMGAVWGRLASEVFGFLNALVLSHYAFAMPFPLARLARVAAAVAAMAVVVRLVDAEFADRGPAALLVLVPAGVCVYAAAAWLLDIAEFRSLCRGSAPLRRRIESVSI